jgi:23S rRNA (adenine2030-N6)-methyltransferase
MNYRHAFHAGGFADVFKHAVLTRVLVHLREKTTPFRVIDVHAGAGLYDLAAAEAARTGEWRDGIGRLFDASLPAAAGELLTPYLAAVRVFNPDGALRYYPGSPLVAARLLRPRDRLVACELVPDAAAALARRLRPIEQAKVVTIDGWIALSAYLPPIERRGVVLLDPPYERPDDFARLAASLAAAYRKWPTGVYVAWYPIKGRDGPERLAKTLQRSGVERALRLELTVAAGESEGRLGSSGLVVVNPPWRLQGEAEIMLAALSDVFARGARGVAVDWIARERAAG